MNNHTPRHPGLDRRRACFYLPLVVIFALLGLVVIGVTGFFRLSADTGALRDVALRAAGGAWQKTIALRVGWITTGMVRAGLSFVEMEPEARAALKVVRGAEVGVYELVKEGPEGQRRQILSRANQEMSARGWHHAVTVVNGQELVAVYLLPSRFSSASLRCCVLVLQERRLVVAAGQANLGPLVEIVRKQLQSGQPQPGRGQQARRT